MILNPDGPASARLLRAILRPEIVARQIIKKWSLGSLDFRLSVNALNRPEYAFGVKQAVFLAKTLGLKSVSVLEFGVAQGGGLLQLEHYAMEVGRAAGIEVEVYGFDLGSGLPAPADYRDLPYFWPKGAYKMDFEALRKQLRIAQLVIGDVKETVGRFNDSPHAPIGFISFDMDFYTSTINAFEIFNCPDSFCLPRVICYFDDIVSDGHLLHCDDVGELLAIREFNEKSDGSCRLFRPPILKVGTVFPALWEQQIQVYHRFLHPGYNTYTGK